MSIAHWVLCKISLALELGLLIEWSKLIDSALSMGSSEGIEVSDIRLPVFCVRKIGRSGDNLHLLAVPFTITTEAAISISHCCCLDSESH